jgi:hypothetical protein
MGIHQIQLRFDATADRLLLQLRSSEAEIYAAWLTRRMVARLLPPFRQAVVQAGLQTLLPHALPVPEARQMLEQAALQRPLPGTQFNQPFVADEHSRHPLGIEPLLPDAADLRPGAGAAGSAASDLHLVLRETRGRQLDIGLTPELATALLRLMDSALEAADWGLTTPAAAAADAARPGEAAAPGPRLN